MHTAQIVDQRHDQPIPLDSLTGSDLITIQRKFTLSLIHIYIWQKLYEFDPVLFSPKLTGPFCQRGCCEEGTMSCGIPIPKEWSPLEIMKADYPLLVEGREAVYED